MPNLRNLDGHEMVENWTKLIIEGTRLKISTRKLICRGRNISEKPRKIKIEINEETVTSTPAQKKQIEKDDALKVATDSIKTDSKIENILNEFDAQIIESTIKSTKIN